MVQGFAIDRCVFQGFVDGFGVAEGFVNDGDVVGFRKNNGGNVDLLMEIVWLR